MTTAEQLKRYLVATCAGLWLVLGGAAPSTATARDGIVLGAVYTADTGATVTGGSDDRLRYADNLDLTFEADLEKLTGWRGARAFVYVLDNLGGHPNDGVGTVQGIDNIEVGIHGPRLYEAWIEQQLGPVLAIRAGLYDLNGEFYATEASDLLIAPPFGIGSELAGTGIAGPSIFPSSALAVRARAKIGETGYVQAALINAHAGTWGDPGGVDTSFDRGLLAIGEAGWGETVSVGLGGWAYTARQDDVFATDGAGNRLRRAARGAYVLTQWRASEKLTLFARAGISDGQTSPFAGGYQLGLLATGIWPGREESAASLGVHGVWLSPGHRQSLLAGGISPSRTETAIELTYSDRLAPHLSIQPDVQYIIHPGGEAGRANAVVTTLRVTVDF